MKTITDILNESGCEQRKEFKEGNSMLTYKFTGKQLAKFIELLTEDKEDEE